ncbi:MAG: 2-hydroxyacid dehydrogenase [Thermovirgaceae bacterium]
MNRARFGFLDVTLIPETRAIFQSLSAEGDVLFLCEEGEGKLEQKLPEIDILFTRLHGIDRAFLERARCLKGIVMAGVGADHIDVKAATELGVPVVISPGNEVSTAESAVLLMLAVARRLALKNKNTTPSANVLGTELFRKTLGLVGTGRVAKQVARIAALGLGMGVIATSPRIFEKPGEALWEPATLERLLDESDVISLHCPLNESTWHLLDEKRLRRMKRGAILVNMARGGIIDEKALIRVLKEGHLAGAGLDVVEEEPLEGDNPLLELENVIVTPHRLTQTTESLVNQARNMRDAAKKLLEREIPETTINQDEKLSC